MGERNRRFLRPGSGEGEGKDMIDKILHPDAKMKKDESTPPPPRRGATLPPHTRSPPREQESLRDSLESRSTPVPWQQGKRVEKELSVLRWMWIIAIAAADVAEVNDPGDVLEVEILQQCNK